MRLFKLAFSDFLKHVVIFSKDIIGEAKLELYGSQRRFLREVFEGLERDIHFFVVLKARQLGLCYDPKTRVLTHDLQWRDIESVKIGDELVSTDDDPIGGRGRGRKMRTCRVQAIREVSEPALKIIMDNGVELIATPQHRHLIKQRGGSIAQWKPASWLRIGDEIRTITTPWDGASYEDGWFGGMIDGEGSLRPKERGGFELCVCQVPGPVLDRARSYLSDRGYHFREEIDDRVSGSNSKFGNKPVHKLIVSRMNEAFRIVGQTRPSRFISKRWWEGKDLPGKKSGEAWRKVVSIEALPPRRMIDLQTSTKTFVAEGFVSHNSTIVRVLIIFWAYMHPGLRVALVYDTDKNKEDARQEIRLILERLPPSHRIAIADGGDNRDMLQFANGSRISYMVAGVKKSSGSAGLGRSRGINCAGCTEVSMWADVEGLRSFERSLSRGPQGYPDSLYIWESTARAFNIFYDIWEEAKADDLTKKAIFIGWWAHPGYSFPEDSPLFERYGSYAPTAEEIEKIKIVKERYGHEVTMGQLAWYRHEYDPNVEHAEKEHAGQDIIQQELPWFEEEAFLKSGASFFSATKLSILTKEAKNTKPQGFRYQLSDDFFATLVEPVSNLRHAHLKVWSEPDPAGFYSIGADPAYGSDDTADRYVVQVLREYADCAEQVAEYCTTDGSTANFAWVLLHLCGVYGGQTKGARFLLELNGPGNAVRDEIKTMQRLLRTGYLRWTAQERGLTNVMDNVREFLFTKDDALTQNPTAWQWESSTKRKVHVMERLRDYVNKNELIIYSADCISEMGKIVRNGDVIKGDGSAKDDRVVALALASHAWQSFDRKLLISQQRTKDREQRNHTFSAQDLDRLFSEKIVQGFFAQQKTARLKEKRAAWRGNRWNF